MIWLYFGFWNGLPIYVMGILLGYAISNGLHVKSLVACCVISNWGVSNLIAGHLIAIYEDSFKIVISDTVIDLRPFVGPVSKICIMAFFMGAFFLMWNGNFSIWTYVLSNRVFQVVSKISFSTFMMHYVMIWYQNADARFQREFYAVGLFNETVAILFLSHVFGFLLYVIIEAPAANLLKFQ